MKPSGFLCASTVTLIFALVICVGVSHARQDGNKSADSVDHAVYHVGNGVTAPKAIYMPNPSSTEAARKKKINGTVTVEMIVTPEGTVRDVRVTHGLEPSLDQQAVATISTWKFKPATKDGKAVAVTMSVETNFNSH